jgi:hypothetical protein
MSVELLPRTTTRDISGFGVFSQGDAGEAHVMAHRMLDEARYELGHQTLGAWLDTHDGAGSDWTHLQWHMAVFEIAVGRWDAALTRFEREIMPVAVHSDDALTDAPAMLWRLWLSAPREVDLPWEPLRTRAVRNLGRSDCAYVELHCLLALAGARDIETLDEWSRRVRFRKDERTTLLAELVVGLRAFAASDYALGASALSGVVPRINQLGGSHAQNLLFEEIATHCQARSPLAA